MKGRIHHIGVAVGDLRSAGGFLEDVLGFQVQSSVSLPDQKLEGRFFSLDGGTQVELFELGDPDARARRLGEGNVARIEHVAIEVEDIDQVREELRGAGVEMQSDTPTYTSAARSYFTRPETSGGVMYQFLDRKVPPGS
jgi:methylmalonyl-CoA/ethylmalonyl-CoA epimerase